VTTTPRVETNQVELIEKRAEFTLQIDCGLHAAGSGSVTLWPPVSEFKIVDVPEQYLLTVRAKVKPEAIAGFLGPAYGKIGKRMAALGPQQAHAPMARYLAMDGEGFDMQAAMRIDAPATGEGEVEAVTLLTCRAVMVEHVGPYQDLGKVYSAVREWAAAQGVTVGDDSWELYTNDPGSVPPEEYRTEIYWPIR
jgi:effector-binding domain-containing protein